MSTSGGNPIGPELLGQLFDRHAATLTLYARQLCAVPDDAVQEAFIELARQRRLPDDPAAWLYRVVRNKAFDAARAARRRRSHEGLAAAERSAWFVVRANARLDAATAVEALAGLAQEEREIVVLHVWGGRTFAEIGRLLDISDSTAHRRYASALDRIRERLGALWRKNV